ncbi:MAG: hypothetical protein FJ137_15085 [Deltaproteobacteria bacterium]|nr:hypothetical protein [Deltaproteobacteria bacterium]
MAALLLLPLACAVVASLALLVAEADDVPADDDLAAACAHAARAAGDDGAIVVLPPWTLRPLAALGPAAARVVGGDGPAAALLPGRFPRVVAVVEPDAAPWLPALAGLGAPRSAQRFGAVDVLVFDGGGPARFDLLTALPGARVDVDGRPCTTPLERGAVRGHGCEGDDAGLRVTREHALVSESGRLVVRVPEPRPGARVALRFDDVALGDTLVVAAGHTRAGAERGRAMIVDVVVDDAVVASLRRAPSFFVEPSRAALRAAFVRPPAEDGEGFRATVIDTRRLGGGAHRLALVVRAAADDGAHTTVDHELALDAYVPGPGGAR